MAFLSVFSPPHSGETPFIFHLIPISSTLSLLSHIVVVGSGQSALKQTTTIDFSRYPLNILYESDSSLTSFLFKRQKNLIPSYPCFLWHIFLSFFFGSCMYLYLYPFLSTTPPLLLCFIILGFCSPFFFLILACHLLVSLFLFPILSTAPPFATFCFVSTIHASATSISNSYLFIVIGVPLDFNSMKIYEVYCYANFIGARSKSPLTRPIVDNLVTRLLLEFYSHGQIRYLTMIGAIV